MKKIIAFDLDGTLAESKQPLAPEMADSLAALLDVAMVCVISGGDWPQFETQVVERLPAHARLEQLVIMPTTGTKMYRFADGAWRQIYADSFDAEEKRKIIDALTSGSTEAGLDEAHIWGERIEDRGTQVTFSGLGQQAPLDAKKVWDPDGAKRKRLQAIVSQRLPELSVKVGGSTSIDITRAGTDKAYGMRRLSEQTGIAPDAILFLGDAVFPGGNDYPVQEAGIDTLKVRDPDETRQVIAAIVACLKP